MGSRRDGCTSARHGKVTADEAERLMGALLDVRAGVRRVATAKTTEGGWGKAENPSARQRSPVVERAARGQGVQRMGEGP